MNTIVIKDNTEGFEIDIKRFYIHGSYEIDCPHCKTKIVDNYKEDYIFYPIIGRDFSRFVTCGYCDTILGDAHLSCNHSAITEDMNVMQRILQRMINDEYSTNPTQLVVNGVPLQEWNESGVRQGYVLFPLNFDPIWLEYCLLYNNKI